MRLWFRATTVGILMVLLFSGLVASEEDTKKIEMPPGCIPFLSTAEAGRPYEIVALISFFQEKETSILGSDADKTIGTAMKELLERAVHLQTVTEDSLDAVIGVKVVPLEGSRGGEFGLWVMGTAVKFTE
jgi:hypothetical protein